ncbi:Fe-S-cluster-containing hydrogenase component 2 [Salinibacter ruber]|uniref:4Fe-4S binding protein n=1 Tax=Salinibacter ruber TaxID=146919 RepID=UPI00216977F7|nr:4Fe-4S binding protein [Salinibacter ruber]MCS3755232.1 Fe-S-cluster-containing hydrogenase component 2 [Salinibacter ruber]
MSTDEIYADTSVDVTYNPDDKICVFDAIEWVEEDQSPSILTGKCVGCGACVGRCPVGAIRTTSQGTAVVNKDRGSSNALQPTVDWTLEGFQEHMEQIRDHTSADPTSQEVQQSIHEFERILTSLENQEGSGLSKALFARNLMASIGFEAKAGNPGDVNSRVDLVFNLADGRTGLVEIETDRLKVLNSTRRLLTVYGKARQRQGMEEGELEVFALWGRFPNGRQDVFELIENIRERTGLIIRAIPLCLIYLLSAHGYQSRDIDLTDGFLLSREKKDVLDDSFDQLGVTVPPNTYNYFGPEK